MNVTVPLYVEERRVAGQPLPVFAVRPLFFGQPLFVADLLSRATTKLASALRRTMEEAGKSMRHDDLARWTFAPETTEHAVTAPLELRRSKPTFRALVVTFRAFGRRVAFAPLLPHVHFEVNKGEKLEARAAEVYAAHFRKLEKEDKDFKLPETFTDARPRGWVSSVDVELHPRQQWPKEASPFMLLGGGKEKLSGRGELEKVGRCLDWLYPDELDRVVLRDAEVKELGRLLSDAERRPVLLVGPPRVGKTAVVHEHVFHRAEARGGGLYTGKQGTWLLAPQRLISGMSYVGQWENRLLAILKEAQQREHVLYFDDLLGLFAAGLSSGSDLSVAHVMRPYVERRDVRVLGEITPQALRVLRERDRGFADLFHVLPIAEPSERDTRRILIESSRRLEGRHSCAFDGDVLAAATDLQRRFVREQAMPGKVAGFLRGLAAKYAGKPVTRDVVVSEFHARSGLALQFLDTRKRLAREDVVQQVGRGVIGQGAAVEAMADAVCVAKARLNDPGRPLATLLFLGPTGVGKTQAAKALATYLFGDADRLLRFDMNEYLDGGSASRLIGSFANPEGLLTSAVRRQPFSVVLLDEIEKAHPSVFDLLLQVLGEGRLTDSLGRTADFTTAIIVMTSNLGVREAGTEFGLRPAASDRDGAFVAAAEAFFRPEFFNRLDRVVPFRPLGRAEVGQIAGGLIRSVFERDGLLSRRCILRVDEQAMARIVDAGFHPQLGARALKRAIERQLTRPVATKLAAMAAGTPTVVSVFAAADGIAVSTKALEEVKPAARPPLDLADPDDVLERVLDAVDRIEAAHEGADGAVLTQGELGEEQFRHLAIRDQADRVRRAVRRAFDQLDKPKPSRHTLTRATVRVPKKNNRILRTDPSPRDLFGAATSAEQVNQFLADLAASATPVGKGPDEAVLDAVGEAALLETMSAGGVGRVLIHVRSLADVAANDHVALTEAYAHAFDRHYGFTCVPVALNEDDKPLGPASVVLAFEFPGAAALLAGEVGTHLFTPRDLKSTPLQVMVVPLAADEEPRAAALAWKARHDLASGAASSGDDPWPIRPVVRVYDADVSLDLASGLVARGGAMGGTDLRSFILARLALPAEVVG